MRCYIAFIIIAVTFSKVKAEQQAEYNKEEYKTNYYQTPNTENQPTQNEMRNDININTQMENGKDPKIVTNKENYDIKEKYTSFGEEKGSKIKRSYHSESYAVPPQIMDDLSKLAKITGQVKNGIISMAAKSESSDNISRLLNVLFAKILEDPKKLIDTLTTQDEINPKTTLFIETDAVAGDKSDLTKGTKINLNHNLFESKDKKNKLDVNLKSEILLFNNSNYKVSDKSGVGLQYQMLY